MATFTVYRNFTALPNKSFPAEAVDAAGPMVGYVRRAEHTGKWMATALREEGAVGRTFEVAEEAIGFVRLAA